MIKSLVILLLFFGLTTAEVDRIYRVALERDFADLKLIIGTSRCWLSGTDGDITPSIGFIDGRDRLLWKYTLPVIFGADSDNLEAGTRLKVADKMPTGTVNEIEEICLKHANGSQKMYENCFGPNVVNIEKYAWHRRSSEWKPGYISTMIDYVIHSNTEKETTEEKFLMIGPFYDCDSNWVDSKHRESYIRWDVKDYISRKYLPSEHFKVGRHLPQVQFHHN
ncbi:hypothetical protein QR680_014331 [Steinernema hermaphroditum]|uniref:Uncharacterized protein n=1 Tax=Steinernema hermaphroditum TaxID=289476 RepID=A0AA39I9X6_9BILA|nr:hypothetical protein QR680_014331 [Steinernema hermaphroditum]